MLAAALPCPGLNDLDEVPHDTSSVTELLTSLILAVKFWKLHVSTAVPL